MKKKREMNPLWKWALIYFYRAALNQIDPMHQDVPEIVWRLNELERA